MIEDFLQYKQFQGQIAKLDQGLYKIENQKQFRVVVDNGQIQVETGGGFMDIESFLSIQEEHQKREVPSLDMDLIEQHQEEVVNPNFHSERGTLHNQRIGTEIIKKRSKRQVQSTSKSNQQERFSLESNQSQLVQDKSQTERQLGDELQLND